MEDTIVFDRKFYKNVLLVLIPIVIQSLITNFVGMLDNIMVGQMGTNQMNGVSVVNQILFIYHLCVWGSVCGAGIFTTQFFGKGDYDGVRDTFRSKVVLSLVFTFAFIIVVYFNQNYLIGKFLHEDGVGNADETLFYARKYLRIIFIELVPMAFNFVYANTCRCIGETSLPMKAGIAGVLVNLLLNYVLIFGHFGFPALGVEGAAIATVIARFVEVGIMVVVCHMKNEKYVFAKSAFKSLRIPLPLFKAIIVKGLPLCMNETLWAFGLVWMNQCYSLRGLSVVAAVNINSTILNIFNVFLFGIGESISILVGHNLGAGLVNCAKKTSSRLILISFFFSAILGCVLFFLRNAFPAIYNTEDEIKFLASRFIMISSCFLPVMAVVHGSYFTLRTGGKTFLTFLFDSLFICCLTLPFAYCLVHFTELGIITIFLLVSSLDLLKATIGMILVKKGIWISILV